MLHNKDKAEARLKEITYVFPDNTDLEKDWNRAFGELLTGIRGNPSLRFHPTPQNTLPLTSFGAASLDFPTILFHTSASIEVAVGKLSISNAIDHPVCDELVSTEPAGIDDRPSTDRKTLSIQTLHSRLKGHVVDIDHTGVNLPIRMLEKSKWDTLMQSLSRITNLYRYPNEAWPFIIPATEEEFQQDITDFTARRTPKFEWVYDGYASLPMFQFALVTDLSRQDLEDAFPAPSGFAIPGLDSIFRSVNVDSPWRDGLGIRVDLYFKREGEAPTDWETGEWLIKEGGRIKLNP